MEHRQAAKSPQSTQVQPSAINSRASPLPDPRIISDVQDGHPPRAILYALRFRFAPIEHCGRRENHLVILAVSYASADNFISSFLIASRLSSLCRNQCHSAQVRIANYSFGKMPRSKHFGTILPAHQQTQLPCATDCKTPVAIALHYCVQAVACNYLHPPQWAQPASNPSFCTRAHTGIRK